VSKKLGHASIKITGSVYVHVLSEKTWQTTDAMIGIMKGKQNNRGK